MDLVRRVLVLDVAAVRLQENPASHHHGTTTPPARVLSVSDDSVPTSGVQPVPEPIEVRKIPLHSVSDASELVALIAVSYTHLTLPTTPYV